MSKNLLEDLTTVFYPDVSLPPLWQVIYHEAMRGNHILFNKERLTSNTEKSSEKHQNDESFIIIAMNILSLSNLSEMRSSLDQLPSYFYHSVFQIYLRLLESLRLHIKSQLN